MHATGINGSIKLMWTTPVPSVIRIDEYILEVTRENDTETITQLPDAREYTIENVIDYKTYWFKIFSISHSEKSHPTEESYYTGRRFSYFIFSHLLFYLNVSIVNEVWVYSRYLI